MHTAFREISFLTVTVAWLSQIMNAIIAGSKIYVSELTFISCSAVKHSLEDGAAVDLPSALGACPSLRWSGCQSGIR